MRLCLFNESNFDSLQISFHKALLLQGHQATPEDKAFPCVAAVQLPITFLWHLHSIAIDSSRKGPVSLLLL